MPAAFWATLQYCSYSRIGISLLKINFCFHTALAGVKYASNRPSRSSKERPFYLPLEVTILRNGRAPENCFRAAAKV